MTELRPWSQDAVACLDLNENKDTVGTQTQQQQQKKNLKHLSFTLYL